MKNLFTSLTICLFLLGFNACTPTVDETVEPANQYVKFFGRNGLDAGVDIIATPSDGGFAVLGRRSSGGALTSQIIVYKMDEAGNTVWEFNYPENADALYTPRKIIEDPAGGYLVAGSYLIDPVTRFIFTLKITTEGGIDSSWGENGFDVEYSFQDSLARENNDDNFIDNNLYDIKATSNGFAIVGSTDEVTTDKPNFNPQTDNADIWVLLLDASGNERFSHRIGYPGTDIGRGIIPLPNDQYAVVGSTTRSAFTGGDTQLGGENVLFSIIDDEGKSITREVFGSQGPNSDNVSDIPVDYIQDGNGFTILANNDAGAATSNAIAFQTSATGKLVTVKNLFVSTTAGDESAAAVSSTGTSLIRTARGEYVMTGNVATEVNDVNGTDRGSDMLVMNLGQDLEVNNDRVFNYGGQEDDVSNRVVQLASGQLMILGTTNFENGNTMLTLMKTNELGVFKK